MDTEKKENRLSYLEQLAHQQYVILKEYKEQMARLDHLSSMMRFNTLDHINLRYKVDSEHLLQVEPAVHPAQAGPVGHPAPVELAEPTVHPVQTEVTEVTTETEKQMDKTVMETVTETEPVEVEAPEIVETATETINHPQPQMKSKIVQSAETAAETEAEKPPMSPWPRR
jgi:hypothetical protein